MFADLPGPVLHKLDTIYLGQTYPAGATVCREQDEMSHICFVDAGILRLSKSLPDGRQHIVGLLARGDMYGRVFDGPMTCSVEAATDAEVIRFPRRDFEDLVTQVPELERVVLLNILNELDAAREWTLILANQRTSQRLAGLLLVLCRRWAKVNGAEPGAGDGRSISVRIPISRSDVAHLLGARPESISRAFRSLSESGHIRAITPYDIEILDFAALIEHSSMGELDSDPAIASLRARTA